MRNGLWVGGLLAAGCAMPTGGDDVATTTEPIIGGADALITDHPWMAFVESLAVYDAAAQSFIASDCGAAVLSPHWVLTAQHCLSNFPVQGFTQQHAVPRFMTVIAGADDLGDLTNAQLRSVVEYVVAPGFTGHGIDGGDVALVRVHPPLVLDGTSTDSIKLLTPSDEASGYADAGVPGTVTGFGLTSNGGPSSDVLQALDVALVDNAAASSLIGAPLPADTIAAYSGSVGQGVCSGDSGGPLVVDRAGQPRLAGVASFVTGTDENPCAQGYPDVYARTSAFAAWVKAVRGTTRTKVRDSTLPYTTSGTTRYLSFTVPAGAVSLDVVLKYGATGAGDANMHLVQFDGTTDELFALPASAYDCAGRANAAEEYCPIPSPAPGTWWVRIGTSTAYQNLRVVASVRLPR